MLTVKRIQILFILLTAVVLTFAQPSTKSFIRNYDPSEYMAHAQNWAIAQDLCGMMYFGNANGLLEFDGFTWRLTELPIVRALAVDSIGRIFVGLENDFGYLQADTRGDLKYFSLKYLLPEIYQNVKTCWQVFILDNQVIFQTFDNIFIYKSNKIQVLHTENGFHISFVVKNSFYVREIGKGLFNLNSDSLKFVEGSEEFAEEKIYAMLPFRQNEILLSTRNHGILVYTPGNPAKFSKLPEFKEVDDYVSKNPVYCGLVLDNGNFCLGTLTGGIIVFSKEGKIQNFYSKSTGLQDNTINRLFLDQNNQLWAALDNGISLVQYNLPFQIYTEKDGLNGAPLCLKYFENHLYVGTTLYLHILNDSGKFEIIPGTEGQNFDLCEANGTLLAGNSGISVIKGKQSIPFKNYLNIGFLSFYHMINEPNYLLAGAGNGIYLLHFENSSWKIKHLIKGFTNTVFKIEVDKDDNIWVNTSVNLYRLKLNNTLDSVIYSKLYSSKVGLPASDAKQGVSTYNAYPNKIISGEVVFGTEKGIYRYRSDIEKFEPHPEFKIFTGVVMPFVLEKNGDIWFEEQVVKGNFEKGVLKFRNGKYDLYKTPFYKFNEISSGAGFSNICTTPDSSVFIGFGLSLLQYIPALDINYTNPFNTLIRKVVSKDTILFGGSKSNFTNFEKIEVPEFKYSINDLIFHFSAAFYEDAEKNLFSYRLIGSSDTSWSSWVSDHKKEYTNLSPGEYTFEVRSKNLYKVIGSIASYSFIILAPWYLTWWAYMLYFVILIVIIWTIVRFYTYRLRKQKEHLEDIVEIRTAEVVGQREVIEGKNQELNQANEELKTTLERLSEINEELFQTNEELTTTLELVNMQKTQIETAHHNITDSINYAQKIQRAVLPSEEMMLKSFPEHFVLFKPRDVISGDFYWIKHINQFTIVATADCTGHGVPGAFMSMLGIALLNEIVTDKHIQSVGEVLDRMRIQIKKTLKQEGKALEQKDGMDLALYVIDKEKMELQYAGAYNSLYLIRKAESHAELDNLPQFKTVENENSLLIEIKADRQPIAIYLKERPFTSHTIKLKKNDAIYTFSDGFVDQTGGDKSAKFLHRNFKSLLLSIQDKTMKEQGQILNQTLLNWENGEDQLDDILVIGVKV